MTSTLPPADRAARLLARLGYTVLNEPFRHDLCVQGRVRHALRRVNRGWLEADLRRGEQFLVTLLIDSAQRGNSPACADWQELLRHGLLVPGSSPTQGRMHVFDQEQPAANERVVYGVDEHGVQMVVCNGLPVAGLLHDQGADPQVASTLIDRACRRSQGDEHHPPTLALWLALRGEQSLAAAAPSAPEQHQRYDESYPLPRRTLETLVGGAPDAQDTMLLTLLSPGCLLEVMAHFINERRLAPRAAFVATQRVLARLRSRRGPRRGMVRHLDDRDRDETLRWLLRRLARSRRANAGVAALDRLPCQRVLLCSDRPDDDPIVRDACHGLPQPLSLPTETLRRFLRTGGAGSGPLVLLARWDALRDALPTSDKREGAGLVLLLDQPVLGLGLLLRRRLPGATVIGLTGIRPPQDKDEFRAQYYTLGPELHSHPQSPPRSTPSPRARGSAHGP